MRVSALNAIAWTPARSRLPRVAAPLLAPLSSRARPLRPDTHAAAKAPSLASARSAAPGAFDGRRQYSSTNGTEGTGTTTTSDAETTSASETIGESESVYPPGRAPPFAFCFDIDGVLLHSSKPIPGAAETLKLLHDHNIPYMLLTNGGGKHDSERAADLSEKLGVPFTEDNIVQSHSPFRRLVDRETKPYRDKTILVTGQDAAKCREIAESYGFKNVIIPADIVMADPSIFPYNPLMQEEYKKTARPLPKPIYDGKMSLEDAMRIDAAFVYNDPRDWAVDLQILDDLLYYGHGRIGVPANTMDGVKKYGDFKVYFSNADFVWSTGYPRPRLGQGSFRAALEALWAHRVKRSSKPLPATSLGKPCSATYRYAERMLREHWRHVLMRAGYGPENMGRLKRVYMIGDNPNSDILGANLFRRTMGATAEWKSVLVKTGVYTKGSRQPHKPNRIVPDVKAAVKWVLRAERARLSRKDHASNMPGTVSSENIEGTSMGLFIEDMPKDVPEDERKDV